MKFWEAMKEMQNGKKVRKKTWDENCYLIMKDNYIVDEWDDDKITFSLDGDWEIYEEKRSR